MKTCTQCYNEKAETEFHMVKGKPRSKCKTCQNSINKAWRDRHPEHSKLRYERDKDRMLTRSRLWRKTHAEQVRTAARNKYANNIPEILLRASKVRAKLKGREHTITLSDIKIPEKCPVLGIPIYYKPTGGLPNPNSPTIDRINNNKGYTPDNIVIVSRRANVLKNDATMDELRRIIDFYDNISYQARPN